MKDLQIFMNAHLRWSNATFGEGRKPTAPAHHLKKEVNELITALVEYETKKDTEERFEYAAKANEEFADCLILLLHTAVLQGLDAEDLFRFMWQKFKDVQKRKWGTPDANGVVEHVK